MERKQGQRKGKSVKWKRKMARAETTAKRAEDINEEERKEGRGGEKRERVI